MVDIVDRLKTCMDSEDGYWPIILCKDAIREIERLRAENERLREALHNIYEYNSNIPLHTDDHHVKHFSKQIDLWANEALEG